MIYLLGVAWAVVQLILGVQYRERLLHWWERLPPSAVWSMSVAAVLLFVACLVDEIVTHGWQL
jgi:hypothetical protein